MFKTALVIDDSRLARLTLKRLLTSEYGIKVFEAEGVLDAEHWVTQNVEPELIFMDVMMPEIDGFEGLARMRKNPNTDHIPVVMYSGDISEEARKKARDSGANGYLPKPVDAQRLEHLLKALSQSIAASSAQIAAEEEEKKAKQQAAEAAKQAQFDMEHQATQVNRVAEQRHFEAEQMRRQTQPKVTPQEVPKFTTESEPTLVLGSDMPVPPQDQKVVVINQTTNQIPEELQQRLSDLEDKVNQTRSQNNKQREIVADIDRQRREIGVLRQETQKVSSVSRLAVILAVLAILIAAGIAAYRMF